ncbi:MAG TPA: amino acid ABC transporter permease [Devosia sp.]|nr:amino acid ABC transporter permease [Devosia sp.]
MTVADAGRVGPPREYWYNNPTIRSIAIQVVLIAVVVGLVGWLTNNTITNLHQRGIASGFGFLGQRAGFDIVTFLPTNSESTYGYMLLAGLVDTVVVSALAIVIATIFGLIVGISRLSSNWLIRTIATVYIEFFRNIPPLLVILFWYLAVIAALPNIRDAIQFGPQISLSNRGFFMPRPVFGDGFGWTAGAFVLGLVIAYGLGRWGRARQMRTGQPFHSFWIGLAIVVVLTGAVFVATGAPLGIEMPVKTRFNINGGWTISPEFATMFLALGIYTASFIAEIVRSGIMAVSHGQTEAARALGLRSGLTLRLVVLPQALRVIIPPLASEYLNITKNTSLAVAVGFADLVSVGNNVLNPTGQSIEVVAIWMAFYLGLSVLISVAMNWFNARIALTER